MWGNWDLGALLKAIWNGAMLQKPAWQFLTKLNKMTIWSSNATLGIHPKELKASTGKRYWYTHVHSSIIHKSPKMETPQCPLMDEQINKMLSAHKMHTVEYYAALKGMSCWHTLITWMNLEDNMLREISQTQRDKYCIFALTGGTQSDS